MTANPEVAEWNQVAMEARAKTFAIERHGAQRYGGKPYAYHLEMVREVLAGFEINGPLGVAAWLHDVLEDTKTTRAELGAMFGTQVADLVLAVSGWGVNRKARNELAYRKIREHDIGLAVSALPDLSGVRVQSAATLKLADRIANVHCSLEDPERLAMYRTEMPRFEEALAGLGHDPLWLRLRFILREN